MIFKVQRPIVSGMENPPWLVYAKWHKHMTYLSDNEITPAVREAMGEDFKAYFEGRCLPGGQVELIRRAGEQPW